MTYIQLPRIEKKVKRNVVEPLKEALINKSEPNFSKLISKVTGYKYKLMEACNLWREDAEKVCKAIKGRYPLSPLKCHQHARLNFKKGERGWEEAKSLNKKIDDLLERAEATGWKKSKDKKFLKLDPDHAFNRAEGPEEVTKYLESVLRKV